MKNKYKQSFMLLFCLKLPCKIQSSYYLELSEGEGIVSTYKPPLYYLSLLSKLH